MEHLQHFGLNQDPFQNEPDLRFYFESASHRNVQRRVERGLRQRKGLTVFTGDSGAGKTLVTRRIFEGLEEEIFEASLMVILPGAADAKTVLTRFARQLGIEEPSSDRSVLLGQIYEKMAIVREEGRHSLLILDDAHVLSSEAIAEVGGLLNLEYEDRRLLSMLWVGSPELDLMLANHPGIAQRVEVRSLLSPLDLENSTAYVMQRLALAGGTPEIVPLEVQTALFKYSRGRPRLLNTLADNALFEAYLEGRKQLAVHDIESAAGELGIGLDPGSTYTAPPEFPPLAASEDAVLGELTDPSLDLVVDSELSPDGLGPAGSSEIGDLSGSSGQVDIGSLFESDSGAEDELAMLLQGESTDGPIGLEGPVVDMLDAAELETGLGSLSEVRSPVRDLDAVPSAGGVAEATRIALPEEEFEIQDSGVSAGPARPLLGEAEATRIAFADEEAPSLDLEEALMPESPKQSLGSGEGGGDEIDDLFVELIDE